MKKKILLLTISILALIFLAVYFIFQPETPQNVLTETYHITDKQYLTEDTTRGALSIDITVEYPVDFSEEKILEKIQAHIITNLVGEQYINVPKDSILQQFVRELKEEYIHNNEIVVDKLDKTGRLVLNNSFTMEGFALLNDEQIFTYGISRDVDFGGNHPTRTRFFYNYNLKTGELITEEAIFGNENHEKLADLLQQEVQRLSRDNDDMPTIDTFEESVYNKEAIRPNGNFYINDEAICYVFNPYEIAPLSYAYETEVRLPYSLIKPLLKENSVIQYLVQQHETSLSANNN
ncbi:MAG: hypothetical protein BGP01_10760 [Paludibacter sp. 47-17]|jgi:hypothetical protein